MTDRAYAYRSLLDAGARLVNGSDAPVEELDPLAGVRGGVHRTGDDRPPFHPEQCVTIDQAFRATTTEPAWLTGAEDRLGTLAEGMEADLVWLDRDPYEDLPGAEVMGTMCRGEWTAGTFM
jgi:predicted amidohydrolase YtcJ